MSRSALRLQRQELAAALDQPAISVAQAGSHPQSDAGAAGVGCTPTITANCHACVACGRCVEMLPATPHAWRAGRRKESGMTTMRKRLAAAGVAVMLAGPAQMIPAQAADDYPTRPVRIIVPFDPGGING